MALLLWEKDLHKLKAHSKYTIIEKRLKGEGHDNEKSENNRFKNRILS